MKMDLEVFFNRLTQTINNNRPAEPEPVVLSSSGEENETVVPNRSPRWQRSTKRAIIIGLIVLMIICLYFLRSMIIPLMLSCLLIFFMKPIIEKLTRDTKISYKWAVILVFAVFLLLSIGMVTAGGLSLYGQGKNFFEMLNNSVDSLPSQIVTFLGGEDSFLGQYFIRVFGTEGNSQINQRLQGIITNVGGQVLAILQNLSSKIGWFFFVFGFSFFVLWESEKQEHLKLADKISIPGYEFDIEMGLHHLSMIWKRFLWGQGVLILITLAVYLVLFIILGVRYSFILACGAALTRLVPYVGSFVAWAAVALVCLFQGTTIFGMQPLPYAILVVGCAFIIDKFMDGFIQPKFLAQTLKVHPAAVLAAALICGRTMGLLGIFLAAPLVATLKLVLRYVIRKLRDEDPWEGLQVVDEPEPIGVTYKKYKDAAAAFFEKTGRSVSNLFARYSGGKGHGAN